MNRLEGRLRKVEAAFPEPQLVITREELHMARLYIAWAIHKCHPRSEIRQKAEVLGDGLIREILRTAKKHEEPQFKEHIAGYVKYVWNIRWGNQNFLPPICGNEYDDWEVPDLYRRRVAIRHDPLVVALIGRPHEAIGAPQYVIDWRRIIGVICRKDEEA